MKKVCAIILILTCGFAANYLIWLGAAFVGLMTNLSLIFLIVAILLIMAAAALLNLVRNKCKDKLHIHGAAVILCAQLPWIVCSLVGFVRSRNYANYIPEGTYRHVGAGIDEVTAGIGIATGLLITAAVFVIADEARRRERR